MVSIQGKIRDYSDESWRIDHQHAMACHDLEDWLDYGLALLASIRKIEERRRSRASGKKTEIDRKLMEALDRLMEAWYAPSGHLLQQIEAMERQGYVVANASEFRQACTTGRMWGMDPAQLHRAAAQFAAGQGVKLKDVTDELRN